MRLNKFFLAGIMLLSHVVAWSQENYDVSYYDFHVTVDPERKFIQGVNHIYFTPLNITDSLQFQLFENLSIDSIVFNNKLSTYRRQTKNVTIPCLNYTAKSAQVISVYYSGKPTEAINPPWEGGFVWKKDSLERPWTAVACEGIGASSWWPCKEDFRDEPDSMSIHITCPTGYQAISNGTLLKEEKKDKFHTYHWKVHYPINNYNVTLYIGKYSTISDTLTRADGSSLSLDYYVLDYNEGKAREHFRQVKKVLTYFEKAFGNYPFEKDGYALVEAPYWGMEHQSAIAYGNNYTNELKLFDFIIVHETAHEWWGNSLTASRIGELWIHEAFATYSEALLLEHYLGKKAALRYLEKQKQNINNTTPMLQNAAQDHFNTDDADIYYKGTWMLHTLRSMFNNDTLWFATLHELAEKYERSIVSTDTILNFFNRKSGLNTRPVFDQYLKHISIPELEYSFKKKGKKIILYYKWNAEVQDFNLPVCLEVAGKKIILSGQTKIMKFVLGEINPESVRIMTELQYIKIKQI